MLGIDAEYLGQTPGTELITQVAEEHDGYRIVLTQEFMPQRRGGYYFYTVFDAAGHVRAISTRDCIFLPTAAHKDAPEPDGRATQQLAAGLLGIIAPKLREIDGRAAAETR